MRKLLIVPLLLLFLVACSTHQDRVNTTSNAVNIISESWFAAQETALMLHDTGVLTGDNWTKVQEVQKKGSEAFRKMWEAWRAVPDVDASIADFIASPSFQNALLLTIELSELANRLDLADSLKELKNE